MTNWPVKYYSQPVTRQRFEKIINFSVGLYNLRSGSVKSQVEWSRPDLNLKHQLWEMITDPDNQDSFFTGAEFYPDLTFYCKLGEDTYPTVSDEKGTLTGGELFNGAADDFKDIPTE